MQERKFQDPKPCSYKYSLRLFSRVSSPRGSQDKVAYAWSLRARRGRRGRGSGHPHPPFPLRTPRDQRTLALPAGPGLGSCPGRSRARSPPESGLSPQHPLRGCPPLSALLRRFPETVPEGPGAARNSRRRGRRARAVTGSQAPGLRPSPRGSPRAHTLRPRRARPPEAGPRPPTARAPPRSGGDPGPTPPPDARPESGTRAAMVTGQRRGAGSWAGRLRGLFLSLPPPLFLRLL